ncbi:hypothetical protein BJX62DRAFT_213154 [Aspergillus germanicus]
MAIIWNFCVLHPSRCHHHPQSTQLSIISRVRKPGHIPVIRQSADKTGPSVLIGHYCNYRGMVKGVQTRQTV